MSFFKNVFGGKQEPKKSAADQTVDSIESLRDKEEQLEKRKELLEKRVIEETNKAKQYTQENKKSQALLCLKKKKMYSDQIQQVDNMILRVTEQVFMLENQRTTVDVVKEMQLAAKATKDNMKESNIDNVDQVMDDIAEANAELQQVQEALNQPLGLAADLDEDELLQELAEMEAQVTEEQMLAPGQVPTQKMPAVPTSGVPAKTQEELELEELQREMAMEAA